MTWGAGTVLPRVSRPARHLPALRQADSAGMQQVPDVGSERPPWLLQQTENPLQTGAPQPARRAFHLAREKVHSCSHANDHGHAQRLVAPRDPLLLSLSIPSFLDARSGWGRARLGSITHAILGSFPTPFSGIHPL